MSSKPYAALAAWQWVGMNARELENLYPGIQSDAQKELLSTAEEWEQRLKAEFPKQGQFISREYYLDALADACGVPTSYTLPDVGEGIPVPRELVAQVILTLDTYGESYGQLMCKEYGDDEDWCEVNIEDLKTWAYDGSGGVIVLDDCLPDEEYQTFELW